VTGSKTQESVCGYPLYYLALLLVAVAAKIRPTTSRMADARELEIRS
jgi:hypothetical protein